MVSDDYDITRNSEALEFKPVRGPTIPEVVAERLRDAILAGKYVPGERLVEQKLAALFGIGQPTVREALRELELQGFVRKRGNRGTFVTQFSETDVRDHVEVQIALETVVIEKAAAKLTQDDVVPLQALLDLLEAAGDRSDRASFHKLEMLFHRRIWGMAGNEYLAVVLERVTFSLFAFLLLERTSGDLVMKQLVEQDREMLNALITREPAMARQRFIQAMASIMNVQKEARGAG